MSTIPSDAMQAMNTLKVRVLKVTFTMPDGHTIEFNQSISIHVNVTKDALSVQNHATIELTNIPATLRSSLLSEFTAFNRKLLEEGLQSQPYINVVIEAGYKANTTNLAPVAYYGGSGVNDSAVIFHGQVTMCSITNGPPNMTIRIECFTNQLAKANQNINQSPNGYTFKQYVIWAGNQMGYDNAHIYCNTKFDDDKIDNFARQNNVAEGLIMYIQHLHDPAVSAYIDDDILYVKNQFDVNNPSQSTTITQFVGAPSWSEYGVHFITLFNPLIRIGQSVTIKSVMNKTLNNTYGIAQLEYDLASRETPFYIKAVGTPIS
jgi:hypothetical protein